MAAINELIDQIENVDLRNRILAEVNKLSKQKKFGLVYEDHIPEATLLYDVPVRKGTKVVIRDGSIKECYRVISINGDDALCEKLDESHSKEHLSKSDLVVVAHFGEPIYPYLRFKDSICNAPDSDLWHTLIEADNYHALQLLVYLYGGKVDCIYIDPPYNTGARDWKYNNDYVDSSDAYRHSKWLSMMEKRLKLAKKLLNPKDSVLIVTIDEKEYLHLGCLLEQMFPEARIQMVSICINPSGVPKIGFSRSDEYAFFVQFGNSAPVAVELSEEWAAGNKSKSNSAPNWRTLRRRGASDRRIDRPNLFYPLIVDSETGKIIKCGESLPLNQKYSDVKCEDGYDLIWPLKPDGSDGVWQISQKELLERLNKGCVRTIQKNAFGWTYSYLAKGEMSKIDEGIYKVIGRGGSNNELQLEWEERDKKFIPGTQWRVFAHNSRENGSVLLNNLIGKRFSYPKSLYAVHDTIRFFVVNKPNAIILDFFAGSGTTLHAVNLLNAEDGGHRRCILVTNNEVSEAEAKDLIDRGYKAGDEEWEKLGIANYVTWERTKCSIFGRDIKGNPLNGNYLGSDIPMANGFITNANFFKLGFLDKTSVSLGRQLKELIPLLWMKAGAIGKCPEIKGDENMVILPKNKFALLVNECDYLEFESKLREHPEIEVVYIITNSEAGYREMIANLNIKQSYQLYRDYLDNFSINYSK